MIQLAFTLSFVAVAPFWALMIFLPRLRFTARVCSSPLIAIGPALVYAVLVVPRLVDVLAVVLTNDVGPISTFLGTEHGAAIGWAHFLALDLLLGRWMYRDARRRGVRALISSPVLALTFLLAPLGLLVHLALRGREWSEGL